MLLRLVVGFVLSVFAMAMVTGGATAQRIQCPTGTYQSVDGWGNVVCQPFGLGNQQPVITQTPRGQSCPYGSYQTVDNYGNSICRSYNSINRPSTDYYDTSRGCPNGFYETVDGSGNRVCRRY